MSLLNETLKELGFTKIQDGYQGPDDCFYEDEIEVLQTGAFSFCMCGDPELNLRLIHDGLRYIDNKIDTLGPFDTESVRNFFFYWCDKEGLSDHGVSIPGWLTDRGRLVLEALNEMRTLLLTA